MVLYTFGLILFTKFVSIYSYFVHILFFSFLPGVRIYAVFGFCDIHHFEDINRLLANDVLVFVNHVAEIVHSRLINVF